MDYDQLAPEQQAYLAERLSGRPKNRVRSGIPKRSYSGPAPLSFAQEGIWFTSQLMPDGALYNIAFTLPLPDGVTSESVAGAIAELSRRHEILCTEFPAVNGTPMQRVCPGRVPELVELAPPPGEAGTTWLRTLVARPFSLSDGPLWRCHLLRTETGAKLFLVIHHLLADGGSVGEMSRQLLELCSRPLSDELPEAESERLQYADFAVWQRQRFESGQLEQHLRYWREKLAGAPARCTFPADRPRRGAISRGETRFFTLGEEITGKLQSLARREEASLFMVLLAAFKALLSRYSGQTDVTVGSPFACRPLPVLERLLGCFVNLLPLRTTIEDDGSFRSLVAQVKQTVLEAHTHEEYPFDRIVEAVKPERSYGVNPLFQTVFSLQEQERATDSDSLSDTETASLSQTAKFDCTLVLSRVRDGITGAVEYDTELFTADFLLHVLDHYRTLIESVLADPQVPVGQAQLFSERQRALLLAGNETAVPFQAGALLDTLFATAEARSEAVAVRSGEAHLTAGCFGERSRNVARRLIEGDAGAGEPVALCAGPSLELVPAIVGILAAGCVYVPLDPGYPEKRLTFMIEDCAARIVLADPSVGDRLAGGNARVLSLGGRTPSSGNGGEPRRSDLAYMIYTSGSTGHPKAAKVFHRGLANLIQWFLAQFAVAAEDRFLVLSSPSFDLTQKNFFAPLCVGAQIHFLSTEIFDPLEIARDISRQQITFINCTPSTFGAILEAVDGRYELLGSLRWVILGGEPIARERLRDWLDSPDCRARIANTYGPTECTDIAAFYELPADARDEGPVPIGRPIANVELAVVDERERLSPLGAIGELWIAGAGVGAGYHARPALDRAKFVRRELAGLSARTWYRTGDLVRYNQGGELLFVGRQDQQLKIRGFRVELEEIESVLARDPNVEEAAVLASTGETAEIRAFVVPAKSASRTLHHLLALRGRGALAGDLLLDLPNGMPVVVPNRPEAEFLYREIWEEESYFRQGIALGDGATVFDIGANAGLFSLHAATRARGLTLFAFEPIPPLFRMLRQNLSIHEVEARCFELGVSSASGSAEFTYYPHVSIISGMHGDAAEDQATMRTFLGQEFAEESATLGERDLAELVASRLEMERFRCPLRTLSELIEEHGVARIDLLKVDVEKSELQVLRGIAPGHWPLIQQVVLEVHDREGSLASVLTLLRGNGFAVEVEQASRLSQTGIHNVYARRPEYVAGNATRTPFAQALPASPRQLEAHLRKFAADHLPDSMVPRAIAVLERFPKTPSGKVDRLALANLPEERRVASVAPRTALEEELAGLWREVLEIEQVGAEDNFFELGGHSLKAAQFAARVRENFAIDFSVQSVFQHSRLSALAAFITSTILREMGGYGAPPVGSPGAP
jgi:amino acid adenylation domain-containing protein/FkbM family methyltransferase